MGSVAPRTTHLTTEHNNYVGYKYDVSYSTIKNLRQKFRDHDRREFIHYNGGDLEDTWRTGS